MEARPDPSSHLALYLPAPLLTRLKAELPVSFIFLIFYDGGIFLCFCFFRIQSWAPFGLQFNHSSLLICFTVEIEAGLRTPAQICEALNQGLVRVRSGMRLVSRGCKPEN